ncbi:MAG: asparagine synthase-related protein [Phycisphaerae bacterium]|jgi:asparagine synthase (glutamine-hydrolysing)
MNGVEVHLRSTHLWRTEGGAHVRGSAFWKDGAREAADLPQVFAATKSADDFVATLKRLNGFHSVIVEREGEVWAAVDHTRSCPLFYGQCADRVYISDDAEWVRARVGDKAFDEVAAAELLLVGYVLGPDTLYPNVKNLQAGETLLLATSDQGVTVRMARYYRRLYENPLDATEAELKRLHEEVLEQAVQRMLTWANGRYVCVPLSAGLDSRSICLMLNRLGYDRVMAFSYGKPGNQESEVSRQIAESLGIPWHFVPYSNEAWGRWFHSPEREAYYRYTDRMSSLQHLQDWPAVWELKRRGTLPDDTIFVPGHAGTRLRSRYLKLLPGQSGAHVLAEAIVGMHYRLTDWDARAKRLRPQLVERVLACCEAPRLDTFEEVERAYEKWVWQERNTKLNINAVRVYEFWGYDWWLPLMDLELLDFWSRVPVVYRTYSPDRELLYEAHAQEMWSRRPGAAETHPMEAKPTLVKRWLNWAVQHGLYTNPFYRAMCKLAGRYTLYDDHYMAYYGIMPKTQFRKLYNGRNTIIPFLALERLGLATFQAPVGGEGSGQ